MTGCIRWNNNEVIKDDLTLAYTVYSFKFKAVHFLENK